MRRFPCVREQLRWKTWSERKSSHGWRCLRLSWVGLGWLCLCTRAVTTPPPSGLVFSPGDRQLRSRTTEAPTAFGHCCRRAGASGEEPNSELCDRKLILEDINGNSNFFFPPLLLVRAADLSEAEPTLTHMSIACLHKHNLVRYFFLTLLMFLCLRMINPAGKRKLFRRLPDYVFGLSGCTSM